MKNLIKKIMSDKELLITYNEILKHPIGVRTELSEGVYTDRMPTVNEGVLFFRVEMSEGTEIPINTHDCFEEFALYKGTVIETFTNTPLKKKKNFLVKKYKEHGFRAMEDSVFYAYLYK